MKKLVLTRRLSQIFFLSLFIYILWLTTNTASFFKIDPLISIFNPFSLMMLILTLIVGRFFCGWICPLGSVIDMCGIKAKNRVLNFRQVKYYILGSIIISAFLGIQIAWIFDPLVITARFISLNFIPSFTFITLSFFIIICSLVLITKRFWCRFICPLGAIYSLVAKFSLLRRHVDKCINCMRCESICRMDAIKEDMSYRKSECILCMDCVYDCPVQGTKFTWPAKLVKSNARDSISRKDFLFLIASSFLLLGFKFREGGVKKKLIRPPGVTNEREFLNKCIRCGNCMKVCPTNGLQPVIFESGLAGIWAPHLVPEIGYCEYNCNLCGNVCPLGAIPKLNLVQKKKQRLGLADIDKNICLPWSQNRECIVCEEHCPVSTKAIKTYDEIFDGKKIKKPYVDASLCIGCGICQNKCPTMPFRAIRVLP